MGMVGPAKARWDAACGSREMAAAAWGPRTEAGGRVDPGEAKFQVAGGQASEVLRGPKREGAHPGVLPDQLVGLCGKPLP